MNLQRYNLNVQISHQKTFLSFVDCGYLTCGDWVTDWVSAFDGTFEAPNSIDPGAASGFLRPRRHRRATYYSPTLGDTWTDTPIICFKGMEPACDNLQAWFQRLSIEGPSKVGLRLLEHFPLVEGKAPIALTRCEAFDEAFAALNIHESFRHAGLEMPRIPFPIAILRHQMDVEENYLATLKGMQDNVVLERTRDLIGRGLYCYVYFFPGASQRVADVVASLPTTSYLVRAAKLEFDFSARATIDRWVRLLSDMFALGYIPASRWDKFTGSCFDQNNCVIGGGVSDVGSCKQFSTFKSDHDIFESMCISIRVLTRTIQTFLLGSTINFPCDEYSNDIISRGIHAAVAERIMTAPFEVHHTARKFFTEPIGDFLGFFSGYTQ
jgi:hypothetical protein